jgi:hypothetical protein
VQEEVSFDLLSRHRKTRRGEVDERFDQDLLNDDLLSSAAFSERAYGLSSDVNDTLRA